AGAVRLDLLALEAAGKHGEATEQQSLVGLEQVVAPLERSGERLLTRRRRMAAAAQQAKAVAQAPRDRRRAQGSYPAGRELQCQRQAVQPEADSRDVRGALRVEREVGRGR